MTRRALWTLLALGVLLAVAAWARLLVGGDGLAWPDDPVLRELRVARVLAGAAVGGSLALAGVLLQCLLRNPLASPDLLGLSTGAGLGVSVAMLVGYRATGTAPTGAGMELPALAGAVAALALTYAISRRRGGLDPATLILVGVIIAILCGAGIRLAHHLLPDRGLSAARWLFGAIHDDLSPLRLAIAGGLTVVAMGLSAWFGPMLDAASLSEEEATSVGVPIGRLRVGLFVGSGVLASLAVVLAGPVGFVGLVAPHAARLLGGAGHRVLCVTAPLAGAALVIGADTLVKAIELPTGRLPIGVVTALIGGPVFLVLLLRTRGVMR